MAHSNKNGLQEAFRYSAIQLWFRKSICKFKLQAFTLNEYNLNGGEHRKKGILCWYINVVRILSEILNHSGQLMFKLIMDITYTREFQLRKRSFVPFAINCHHTVININPQVYINFPIVGETNSMQPRRETAWLTTPRSLKQWRRGIGVAFPTSSKSSLWPRPRPNRVALSFNFVRFTRSPIAILGSIIAFSRLIPRKQCSATVFERIKRSSLATTKMKKSNRDELRVSLPE